MDKENMVYIDNEVLFSHIKNEITLFAGKWMKLEQIMLSEIRQTDRNLLSLMWNLILKSE
jgi:hypothetical protein